MSCAACQARVEKAVSAVPGVENCAVSLLTNSMGVEGTADSADVIKAVTDAGYGAVLKDNNAQQSQNYRQYEQIDSIENINTCDSLLTYNIAYIFQVD